MGRIEHNLTQDHGQSYFQSELLVSRFFMHRASELVNSNLSI
jgi:hypothetical protein